MIRRSIEMILSRASDGSLVLNSPALGLYGDPPRTGEGLIAGSVAGTLVVLGRTMDLLVPEGGAGTVTEVHVHDKKTPVTFAQPLVSLLQEMKPLRAVRAKSASSSSKATLPEGRLSTSSPSGAATTSDSRSTSNATESNRTGGAAVDAPARRSAPSSRHREDARSHHGREDALPPGSYALRAPTTGVFYARPDPDSPPFVVEGSTLETGQTAGLIEVMKCFSPIVHPGGVLPSPVVVESLRVREGEEVRPGKILFVLRRP